MPSPQIYTEKIPYFGSHGDIVVDTMGQSLKDEFKLESLHVFIDDGLQYIAIKGFGILRCRAAAIRVQGLIISSMARTEQSQIEALETERCALEETRTKFLKLHSWVVDVTSQLIHQSFSQDDPAPITGEVFLLPGAEWKSTP